MFRSLHQFRKCRQRWIALLSLILFTAGNIGWPVTIESASGGACCKVSGRAVCCCGEKPGAKTCGCSKPVPVAQKTPPQSLPSCCQKRLAEAEKDIVGVTCACGDSSDPVFVFSTQPKISIVTVHVAELAANGNCVPAELNFASGSARAPEIPPPRSSAC